MGWTSTRAIYFDKHGNVDRKAECDELFESRRYRVLASSMVGSTYYAAVQHLTRPVKDENGKYIKDENGNVIEEPIENGEVFAAICLTSVNNKSYYNFSYKDMTDDMGPCEDKCPKKILKLLSPTDNEYAIEWRNRCQNHNTHKLTKIKIGQKILVNGNLILQKMAPAYQFKTPWFRPVDSDTVSYFKKKDIDTWELLPE